MSKNICYFPVIISESELIDVISRATWFFSHCPVSKITIPVSSAHLCSVKWRVAPGMDNSILHLFSGMKDKISFVVVSSQEDLDPYMENANIILKWHTSFMQDFISVEKLRDWERNKKVWAVDPIRSRMEGSIYIEVGLHLLEGKMSIIDESKNKFKALVSRLGSYERAYIMATGPSISRFRLFDYGKSITIVCNSVILDDELMNQVNPQILVFADPIFHFGPSEYAASFRQRLREAAAKHDFSICMPFKYFELFVYSNPDLVDRTIAIPFVKDRSFNFDIQREFEVKTTANILTLLLLPLATTFANDVGILGCDGRPLEENNYFWQHNQKTQINDKMANIKEVHPAFFAIDYNNYYSEHCSTLESQLRDGEVIGKRFTTLGFSYIPALQRRMGSGNRYLRLNPFNGSALLILDPDAKSWAGHYMAYNEKLSKQFESEGYDVGVICRHDLSRDILSLRSNYSPILTAHSWEIGNRDHYQRYVDEFESQITRYFEQYFSKFSGPVLLYMYCGSLEHSEILFRIASQFPQLFVNINLFWLSFKLTEAYAEKWYSVISLLDKTSGIGNFVATVPTKELRDRLARLTGCVLPVAPHPSTGVSDSLFVEGLSREAFKHRRGKLNILFPGALRLEKGYKTSIGAVQLLCERPEIFHPIIRYAPTLSTPKTLLKSLSHIEGVEVVEGELADEDLLNLFSRADIVVLPYTPDAFSERTSGLLIDSIYFGIPCVVVHGTWLGNLVSSYGCGVVIAEPTSVDLFNGVKEISENYEHYSSRARQAGLRYFQENSWSVFSRFLRRVSEQDDYQLDHSGYELLGPFGRENCAHWDETKAIAELFSTSFSGKLMVDVGAHHGSALMPFLNKGWSIFAFEPDLKNRTNLLERLSKHKHKDLVCLDTRCVSNISNISVPFYASEQSTGISGLSAFHESHAETQQVDVTTLREFFSGIDMPSVDFLKIDTEGHDLFVLQGYPWERTKPSVIECEFEDSKTVPLGYTFHDLAGFLVEHGYTVYMSEWHPIIRYGMRHDWCSLKRYPCELADPKGWGNFLAFRDPVDEPALVDAVKNVLKIYKPQTIEAARQLPGPTVFSTSIKQKKSVERLFCIDSGSSFRPVAANQWRFINTDAKQKLWLAVLGQPISVGQTLVGHIRIQTDQDMSMDVSIGRHGKTEYEGASKRIALQAGVAQRVVLEKTFSQSHQAIKLQIDVLTLSRAETAILTIDLLGIGESAGSVLRRLGDADVNIKTANRLFRQKDYVGAVTLNIVLGNQHSLGMYADNAVRSARAAGLTWVKQHDDLAWLASYVEPVK